MKVDCENVAFNPITITLEDKVELDILMPLLCNSYFEELDVEGASCDMLRLFRNINYDATLSFIKR